MHCLSPSPKTSLPAGALTVLLCCLTSGAVSAQGPFGFALYSDDSAKPEWFKKHVEEEPLFYFPPVFFVGIRF